MRKKGGRVKEETSMQNVIVSPLAKQKQQRNTTLAQKL